MVTTGTIISNNFILSTQHVYGFHLTQTTNINCFPEQH